MRNSQRTERLVMAMLGLLLAVPAWSDSCPQQAKSAPGLREIEQHWVQALEGRDSSALQCILALDFSDIGTSGQQRNREEVIEGIASRPDYRSHLTYLQTMVVGDVGVVRGLNLVTDQDGRHLAQVRFTDVFLYAGGGWKAVFAQETLVQEHR